METTRSQNLRIYLVVTTTTTVKAKSHPHFSSDHFTIMPTNQGNHIPSFIYIAQLRVPVKAASSCESGTIFYKVDDVDITKKDGHVGTQSMNSSFNIRTYV